MEGQEFHAGGEPIPEVEATQMFLNVAQETSHSHRCYDYRIRAMVGPPLLGTSLIGARTLVTVPFVES